MKDCLQFADPVPQLLVFGAKGLQLVNKLSFLLSDQSQLLQLAPGLQVLVVLVLYRCENVLLQ